MPSLSEGGDVQEGDFLLMAKGRFVGQFDLDHKIHEHRARDNFKTKKMRHVMQERFLVQNFQIRYVQIIFQQSLCTNDCMFESLPPDDPTVFPVSSLCLIEIIHTIRHTTDPSTSRPSFISPILIVALC